MTKRDIYGLGLIIAFAAILISYLDGTRDYGMTATMIVVWLCGTSLWGFVK